MVNQLRLGFAPDLKNTQFAKAHMGYHARIHGGHVIGPNFARPRALAQPRGHVDGITIGVAIHLQNLSTGNTHVHFQAQDFGPALKVDLVAALQFAGRRHRMVGAGKDAQHAVSQHLDHTPLVRLHDFGDPLREAHNRLGRALVAHRLVQRCASGEIGKNHRRDRTHGDKNAVVFINASLDQVAPPAVDCQRAPVTSSRHRCG